MLEIVARPEITATTCTVGPKGWIAYPLLLVPHTAGLQGVGIERMHKYSHFVDEEMAFQTGDRTCLKTTQQPVARVFLSLLSVLKPSSVTNDNTLNPEKQFQVKSSVAHSESSPPVGSPSICGRDADLE